PDASAFRIGTSPEPRFETGFEPGFEAGFALRFTSRIHQLLQGKISHWFVILSTHLPLSIDSPRDQPERHTPCRNSPSRKRVQQPEKAAVSASSFFSLLSSRARFIAPRI